MTELVSRICSVIRRSGLTKDISEIYKVGGLELNTEKHIVKVYGREVYLSFKEYSICGINCTYSKFCNDNGYFVQQTVQ